MNKQVGIAVALLALVGVAVWFLLPGKPKIDVQKAADDQVESWSHSKQVDAIEFLESNGRYYTKPESKAGQIDQEVIYPLIKRLRDEAGVETLAVLQEENPKQAFAIVVDLQKYSEKRRDQIQAIIEEADTKFEGVILQQYGNRWAFFECMDQQEATQLGLGNNWHEYVERVQKQQR